MESITTDQSGDSFEAQEVLEVGSEEEHVGISRKGSRMFFFFNNSLADIDFFLFAQFFGEVGIPATRNISQFPGERMAKLMYSAEYMQNAHELDSFPFENRLLLVAGSLPGLMGPLPLPGHDFQKTSVFNPLNPLAKLIPPVAVSSFA